MKIDIEECKRVARKTEVFKEDEIEVLEELLQEISADGQTTYRYVDIREGGKLVGFAIYGLTPMTEFGYDLYWILVSPEFQGRGFAKKLIIETECKILKESVRGVIRIETSSLPIYEPARKLYERTGYEKGCQITDFYGTNDDLVLYFKKIMI